MTDRDSTAEASLSHLFQAGGYDPDCLEERFPIWAGRSPPLGRGANTAHPVVGHMRPRDVSSSLTSPVGLFYVLKLREVPIELGPLVRCPSRRLCAIPRDNLLGQIDEGAQARGHVAASWIIQAISRIRGRAIA